MCNNDPRSWSEERGDRFQVLHPIEPVFQLGIERGTIMDWEIELPIA